jgi:hypothetical protein
MLLKTIKKYAPSLPLSCPIPRGWQDHKFLISANHIKEDEFFWGNFYPPSGLYKFKLNSWNTKDPQGAQIEWVTEIRPRKGQIDTAEW